LIYILKVLIFVARK